jgi:hypothetical protein
VPTSVAEFNFFPTQMEEFFFFGGLMVAVMLLFVFLSWRYEDMPHLSKEIISFSSYTVYTSLHF